MTQSEPNRPMCTPGGNDVDKSPSGPRETKGIEIDEQRPFGSNSAWAPQGRHAEPPSQESAGSTQDEPTHNGKTQSTTNSQ